MKPIKITFTNSFLNNFEGNQEELDSIVEELTKKFAAGEFEEILDDETSEVTIGSDGEEIEYPSTNTLH